jgi:hypothetical protein
MDSYSYEGLRTFMQKYPKWQKFKHKVAEAVTLTKRLPFF